MQASKPYIWTGLCYTFSPSFRQKCQLRWNYPTPSWGAKQPIGDKKSGHVTKVSYAVFLLSMVLHRAYSCAMSISNGNRTEWGPIRSVTIRVINKIGDLYLYSPRMTPTPKWSPTPKSFPNRPRNDPQLIFGNGMVFRHGIITSLLQRLRSLNAFNISLLF